MEAKCIDVSYWQGDIDWKKVSKSGVKYAIIRAGYRGYTTGKICKDTKAEYNIEQAQKNGISCGIYFFSQAVNQDEAFEEADFLIDIADKYQVDKLFIDTELGTVTKTGRADNLSKEARTQVVNFFCMRVATAGYEAGVYASKNWFENNLNDKQLVCDLRWVAQYADKITYKGDWDLWQYTSKGKVDGIKGYVDVSEMSDVFRALFEVVLKPMTLKPENEKQYQALASVCEQLDLDITLNLSLGDYKTLEKIWKEIKKL